MPYPNSKTDLARQREGQYGSVFIDDLASHPGPFSELYALTDCTIGSDLGVIDDFVGFTLAAGQSIKGLLTSAQIVTGTAIAYKRTEGGPYA